MNSIQTKESVPANGSNRAFRPLRVLVIEDNLDIAKSIALMLRLQGHEVYAAADGETALGLAHDAAPDVVLINLNLRGTDTCQLARRLQQRRGGDKILFVAVTATIPDDDRARVAAAGIHLHCPPNSDPEMLLAILKRYATSRR
jgi:CheY-like chemotaxis protein